MCGKYVLSLQLMFVSVKLLLQFEPALLARCAHSGVHARPQVVSCSRQDSHAWKECPFAHPKENARRRDVQLFSYTTRECPCYKASGLCVEGAYAVPCPMCLDLCIACFCSCRPD